MSAENRKVYSDRIKSAIEKGKLGRCNYRESDKNWAPRTQTRNN